MIISFDNIFSFVPRVEILIKMLKNDIKFIKLTIFEIFYETFMRNEIIIIAIINVFFNYSNFFDEIIKVYFELRFAWKQFS